MGHERIGVNGSILFLPPFIDRQQWPPVQSSIVTRVLETQSTYCGYGSQGTHSEKDSMTQVKIESSCSFLLNGLIHSLCHVLIRYLMSRMRSFNPFS